MFKEIKYFIQRGKRGYSDRDMWSIVNYLSKTVPSMIRKLKNTGSGCPSDLYDNKCINNECHKWKEVLEEIAQGFECMEEINITRFNKKVVDERGCVHFEYDEKLAEELLKKQQRGMELFSKYYNNLWG